MSLHANKTTPIVTVESANVKMPFPISDIMANYMAGGENGNDDEQGFIIPGQEQTCPGNFR